MVVRKCATEKFMRKNLRPLDTKELEGGFGGTQTDIGSFKGFADFEYTA
jgi:hypothetical protein